MRRLPLSLALRLTLLFGSVSAVVFFIFGWLILHSIERHFIEEDMSELNIIMAAIQNYLSEARSPQELVLAEDRFNDVLTGHHSASLYIADSNGQRIYTSGGPDLSGIVSRFRPGNSGDTIQILNDAEHNYRVLTRRITNASIEAMPSYTAATAVLIDYHLKFLEEFHYTLWLMIASSILLTGLMGWRAVHYGHIPLRDIITQIRRISANELNTRLSPEAMPSELIELASSFNDMMERMESAFGRLKNYSADIAHELRTPITNLMTQTQVALTRARSIDEYREVLYSNMEEYERMAQMVGDMLFLAQAENGLCAPAADNVNLADEVRGLFDYYEAWAEERGVTLNLEGVASARGDRLMLRRVLSNLLSNAIRHTPPGLSVQVSLDDSGDHEVNITVENPGTAIPPEHIPRIFDRFYRIDPLHHRENDGIGLGLAIAKSIVDAHFGKIDVISTHGLTRFYLILPKSQIA